MEVDSCVVTEGGVSFRCKLESVSLGIPHVGSISRVGCFIVGWEVTLSDLEVVFRTED